MTPSSYLLGDWDGALTQASEFIAEIEAGSPHYLESANRIIRAQIRLGRDDPPGALDDTARALERAREIPEPQVLFWSLAVRAKVLWELGRVDAAGEHVQELRTRVLDLEQPLSFPPDLVWMFDQLGLWSDMRQLFDTARTTSRELQVGNLLVDRDFDAAIDLLVGTDGKTLEAWARLITATELAGGALSAEPRAHLDKALAFYRSVGATFWLRRGEELLARSA